MFVIGTAQPYYPQVSGPSDGTYLLNIEERIQFAEDLAERRLDEIPIVIEHAGGENHLASPENILGGGSAADQQPNGGVFRVPNNKRIGRLAEALVDRHGHLIAAGELFYNAPEVKEVIEGINTRGERWGFSFCTDVERPAPGIVRNKRITHLGLTRDPAYGSGNDKGGGATWVHAARTTPDGMEDVLAEYAKEPGMYVPEPIRRRLMTRSAATGRFVSVGATARRSESETPGLIHPLPSAPTLASRPSAAPAPTMSAAGNTPAPISLANDIGIGAPAANMPRIDAAAIAAGTATGNSPTAMSPAAQINAHMQQQAITNNGQQRSPEQLELSRRDLEELARRSRDVLSKVDFSKLHDIKDIDEATYYGAIELRRRLMQEIERAQLPVTQLPMGINASLGKLEEYIMSVNDKLQEHITTTNKDKEAIAAYERYLKEPDTFRPIVSQVMASRNAIYSQKEAERKLQEERVLLEKQLKEAGEEKERVAKRVRELEDLNASSAGIYASAAKRFRVDTPGVTPSSPVTVASTNTTTTSVIASNGSSLPKGAELDDYWTSRLPASRDFARSSGWLTPGDEKVLSVIQGVRRATLQATAAGMTSEGVPESMRRY